ncbi:MAG: hypothetical protein AB1558_11855 [Thermodesulfobacteriota bacterium]
MHYPSLFLIEGAPSDGLAGAWSVARLDEFIQPGAMVREGELHDGHGVIVPPFCSTTLVTDETISTAIIHNVKRGAWYRL